MKASSDHRMYTPRACCCSQRLPDTATPTTLCDDAELGCQAAVELEGVTKNRLHSVVPVNVRSVDCGDTSC